MSSEQSLPNQLLEIVKSIAKTAGDRIMEVYNTQGEFDVAQKADKSPLTVADMAAHETIVAGLTQLTPMIPILSEESAHIPYSERSQWQRYWLVDPLDGTREFIKRNGEFTVNIALIDSGQPVLGVVYVPVTQVSYYAALQVGAFKQLLGQAAESIKPRPCSEKKVTIAGSRSHNNQKWQQFVEALGIEVNLISIGSSLKSCLVAEGIVDVYPRFGPTSEWDTAAAQCIVEQAGGYLTDMELKPLRYNTKDSLLNPHFLVYGDATINWSKYLSLAIGISQSV